MLQLDIRAAFRVAPSAFLRAEGVRSRADGAYAKRPLRRGELFRIPVIAWGDFVEADEPEEFRKQVSDYERLGYHYHRFEVSRDKRDPVVIYGQGTAPLKGTMGLAKRRHTRVLTPAHAAFIHPRESWGYMLNDAGYSTRVHMSSRVYDQRARDRNHATFLNGVGTGGMADCLFLHMEKDVPADEEVFVTYGWGFWSQGGPSGVAV